MLKQAGNATVVAPSASWSARRGAGSDHHHLRGEPTDRHFHLGHFDAVGPWGVHLIPRLPDITEWEASILFWGGYLRGAGG